VPLRHYIERRDKNFPDIFRYFTYFLD